MSSDRNSTCWKCVENLGNKIKNTEKHIAESYGKIPFKDFEVLTSALDTLKSLQEEERGNRTLREDWEVEDLVGTDELVIRYSWDCHECDNRGEIVLMKRLGKE